MHSNPVKAPNTGATYLEPWPVLLCKIYLTAPVEIKASLSSLGESLQSEVTCHGLLHSHSAKKHCHTSILKGILKHSTRKCVAYPIIAIYLSV